MVKAGPTAAPAKPPAKPKRHPFRRDYDEDARAVMTAVKPWTMTSYDRLSALVVAVGDMVASDIPGDVVERGVCGAAARRPSHER